ncbi:hypothetical protein SCP_1900640 [Sparassis crispa]|uniref:NAD(P)-binding domain-containing protein n=1 Tax=Sparassis crispa TaxID=139825 RepID=A0A401H712_9APHY|nr:hypothetical protein SCP_1900640 [Sparassis crispa]GBE90215.1 hypothetical protein SCP_1900640 [Sparassis crispa]
MNVYALGASKNIGYYSAVRLLRKGATVTFLMRNPAVFDDDELIQKYVTSGKARIVKGDALNVADVQHGWETAREGGQNVDTLLFTIGGIPHFSFSKGFLLDPPNICTHTLLNVLCTIPVEQRAPATQPRIIAVSSTGITRASHGNLPFVLKPLYGFFLDGPHKDKLGLERVLAYCARRPWIDQEPRAAILSADWTSLPGLPAEGELKHVVVLRPALLMGESCKGDRQKDDKPPYKAAEHDLGGYTISRQDVAHFIVEGALAEWDKWEGKCVDLAY